MQPPDRRWPATAEELVAAQAAIGAMPTGARGQLWHPGPQIVVAGCFVACAPARRPGGLEAAWAAAVAWRPVSTPVDGRGPPLRRADALLRGSGGRAGPRQASDVEAQHVVTGTPSAPYVPGLLALREGALLEEALRGLGVAVDVVLVDATGLDHPRGAGLALHLGFVIGIPTVGVTHRALLARGEPPVARRGASTPALLHGVEVGRWVCTRTGARPVLVHAGWRTDPQTAVEVVLRSSSEAARTPIPLQEARRVAREARALADDG